MLQSMKHRGPDSTGFALFGAADDLLVMRLILAEPGEAAALIASGRIEQLRCEVESRLAKIGAAMATMTTTNGYAFRATMRFPGELQVVADALEAIPGCKVLSLGQSLEIIKDLGDASTVDEQYSLSSFTGTHGIGHVRMATESDVDLSGAHPYWAYPFGDVAVVHNGQLTNYHQWRRRLIRQGYRFQSECDSEVIAVYLAAKMQTGMDLEAAMHASLEDLDGVFTYVCVTRTELGFAKDAMAVKPLVLFESDDLVAVATEEVAIRHLRGSESVTRDPLECEVQVWSV